MIILKLVNLKYHEWVLIGAWAAIRMNTKYKFTTYLTAFGAIVSLFEVTLFLKFETKNWIIGICRMPFYVIISVRGHFALYKHNFSAIKLMQHIERRPCVS